MTLYKFIILSNHLDKLGYPQVDARSFEPQRTELIREERDGKIVFREDGVYRIVDGVEYRGYMYLKKYFINRYDKYPVFHITKCSTVSDIEKRIDFVWDRSSTAKIQDRDNLKYYEVKLSLCKNCKSEASIAPKTTEDFRKLLDLEDKKEEITPVKLGIDRRPLSWKKMSQAYRTEKNYTCENCGFGGEMLLSNSDKEFIHCDHIVSWELANMKRNNLKCLCILCHSQKDELHKKNFSKSGMRKRLNRFLEKYRDKLIEIGNTYVSQD
jgi:hypothetical protein